jgi:hypothetical protein
MDLSDRIAICFGGQIRTGVYTSTNILRYIGDLLPRVDFFIHTWDTETISPQNLPKDQKFLAGKHTPISTEKIDRINEIYHPIKIQVDNFSKYVNNRQHLVHELNRYRARVFYSPYESIKLKKEYERLNNSVYNIVMKLRPDMLFGKYGQLAYEIEYTKYNYTSMTEHSENKLYVNDPWNKLPEWIEDVCWLSSSYAMDVTCDVIFDLENTDLNTPQTDWQHQHKLFLDRNGIIPRSFKNNGIRIYRDFMVGTNIMDIL